MPAADTEKTVESIIPMLETLVTTMSKVSEATEKMKKSTDKTSASFTSFKNAIRSTDALDKAIKDFLDIQLVAKGFSKSLEEVTRSQSEFYALIASGKGLNNAQNKQFKDQINVLKDLEKQENKIRAAHERMLSSMKPLGERIKALNESVISSSTAMVAALAGATGLSFAFGDLSKHLSEYNRTIYESVQVGEKFGETLGSVEEGIKRATTITTFSKQQFAGLKKSFNDLYLGIPPTTAALADFASKLQKNIGYSAEKTSAAMQDLLSWQSKMPDIMDRVSQAMDEFNSGSAQAPRTIMALRMQMERLGFSYADVRKVMTMVKPPTEAAKKILEYEKSMEEKNRAMANAQLELAQSLKEIMVIINNFRKAVVEGFSFFVEKFPLISKLVLNVGAAFVTLGATGLVIAKLVESIKLLGTTLMWVKNIAMGTSIGGAVKGVAGQVAAQTAAQAAIRTGAGAAVKTGATIATDVAVGAGTTAGGIGVAAKMRAQKAAIEAQKAGAVSQKTDQLARMAKLDSLPAGSAKQLLAAEADTKAISKFAAWRNSLSSMISKTVGMTKSAFTKNIPIVEPVSKALNTGLSKTVNGIAEVVAQGAKFTAKAQGAIGPATTWGAKSLSLGKSIGGLALKGIGKVAVPAEIIWGLGKVATDNNEQFIERYNKIRDKTFKEHLKDWANPLTAISTATETVAVGLRIGAGKLGGTDEIKGAEQKSAMKKSTEQKEDYRARYGDKFMKQYVEQLDMLKKIKGGEYEVAEEAQDLVKIAELEQRAQSTALRLMRESGEIITDNLRKETQRKNTIAEQVDRMNQINEALTAQNVLIQNNIDSANQYSEAMQTNVRSLLEEGVGGEELGKYLKNNMENQMQSFGGVVARSRNEQTMAIAALGAQDAEVTDALTEGSDQGTKDKFKEWQTKQQSITAKGATVDEKSKALALNKTFNEKGELIDIAGSEEEINKAKEKIKKEIEDAQKEIAEMTKANSTDLVQIQSKLNLDAGKKKIQQEFDTVSSENKSKEAQGTLTDDDRKKEADVRNKLLVIDKADTNVLKSANTIFSDRIKQVNAVKSAEMERIAVQTSLADAEAEASKAFNLGAAASYEAVTKQIAARDESIKALKDQISTIPDTFDTSMKEMGQKMGKEGEGLVKIDFRALNFKQGIKGVEKDFDALMQKANIKKDSPQYAVGLEQARTAWKDIQNKEKESLNLQKEKAELSKDIREGYLRGLQEQISGAGGFEQTIGTQARGYEELQKSGAKTTMATGGELERQAAGIQKAGVVYGAGGLGGGGENLLTVGVDKQFGVEGTIKDKIAATQTGNAVKGAVLPETLLEHERPGAISGGAESKNRLQEQLDNLNQTPAGKKYAQVAGAKSGTGTPGADWATPPGMTSPPLGTVTDLQAPNVPKLKSEGGGYQETQTFKMLDAMTSALENFKSQKNEVVLKIDLTQEAKALVGVSGAGASSSRSV